MIFVAASMTTVRIMKAIQSGRLKKIDTLPLDIISALRKLTSIVGPSTKPRMKGIMGIFRSVIR